ncbi:MAG: ABC transporter substrate-binding protein [Armatimonadota bacterium]
MTALRRVVLATAVLAVLGLTLTGCPRQQGAEEEISPVGEPTMAAPEEEPIKIGALFAVTGPASALGEPERDTAVMLEEHINESGGIGGRPIEVIVRDTKGDETEALNAAMELIDKENVVAIVGPSRSGTTLGIVDYVMRSKVPLMSCAAARKITDPVKEWVFQVAPGDRDAVFRIYGYMQDQAISRIALLTASSGFGEEGRKQLEEQADDFGIEIVTAEQFADSDNDMTAQLTRIRGTSAQAVVCWGVGKAPALVARNMQQLGMQIPLYQSHGVANERFIEVAGGAADGVIMPAAKLIVLDQLPADDPQLPALRQYHDMFVAEYEREPDHYGGHAWDSLHIVFKAIERAGPEADREAIRDEIEATEAFVGIGGVFSYSESDHYGLSPEAFAMVRIEDGRWTLIE